MTKGVPFDFFDHGDDPAAVNGQRELLYVPRMEEFRGAAPVRNHTHDARAVSVWYDVVRARACAQPPALHDVRTFSFISICSRFRLLLDKIISF